MDWIDGLLGAGGFLFGVGLVVAGKSAGLPLEGKIGGSVAAALALAPIALRRVIFGRPHLAPPREGAVWSLVSIASLFATLFGLPMILFGGLMLTVSFRHQPALEPDQGVDAEVARRIAAERMSSLEVLGAGVGLVTLGSVGHWARRRPVQP